MIKAAIFFTLASAASAVQAKTAIGPTNLRTWLKSYLQEDYQEVPGRKSLQYDYKLVDLNGDGTRELLVYVDGGPWTGGAGLTVLKLSGGKWRQVTQTSIGWSPIRVLRTRTNGWRDLSVLVSGGGVTRPYEARLRFNGKGYPENPSVPPASHVPTSTPGELAIERGKTPIF